MFRALNLVFRKFSDLPPHTKLGMPSLSPTMTTGTIVKWLKKEGEKVKAGESMFEVETDKATVAFEVQDDVFLAKILAEAGSSPLPLGSPVAILVDKADRISAFTEYKPETVASTPENPEKQVEPAPKTEVKSKMSPAASTMIHALHLEADKIKSTGPKGLILKEDVLSYIEASKVKEKVPAPEKPASKVADTVVSSTKTNSQAPRFSLSTHVNLDLPLTLFPTNITAFLIKAATASCQEVPEAHSRFFPEFTRFYPYVDTQVSIYSSKTVGKHFFQDCEQLKVSQIVEGLKTQKSGNPNFEVTFGTDAKEISTPTTSTLLSISPVQEVVKLTEQGLKTQKFVKATLNCDHRAVDGAVGASWLKSFKHFVENPSSLI